MATRLKGLVIDRVDFVDAGANPGAQIVIAKRQEPKAVNQSVDKQGDVQCANCGAKFDTKQQLEAHMAEEKDKPEAAYKAEIAKRDAEIADLKKRADDDHAEVVKMREDRERTVWISKAATLTAFGKADDFGPLLYKISKALTAEELASIVKTFQAVNERVKTGKLFAETGSDASGEGTATDKLDAIVKARIAKSDKPLTYEQAYAEAIRTPEGRQLYADARGSHLDGTKEE